MSIFGKSKPSALAPSTYASLPDDQDNWSCGHWKIYYERCKALYGKEKASQIVITDGGNTGMWADLQWCKYDCEWVNYFAKEGLPGSNIFSKIYCTADGVVTATGGAVKTISNTTNALSKLTENPIIPIALLGGLGYLAYTTFYGSKKKK